MMLAFSKYYSFLLVLAALVLQQTGGRLTAESEEPPQSEEPPRKTQEAPFQLDEPTYFGSGCLPGTIVVVPAELGGETATVSVLFSDYIAATDGSTLRVRKTCNLALPVHVAPGLSVGIFQVDYRGNAYVPSSFASSKPYASFNAEYFFANQRGPIKRRTYTGGLTQALDQEFFETDTVGAIAWSECGGSTNFRINTSLLAMKRNRNDQDVVISMDTADIDQDGFYFEFRSRQC